MSVIIAFVGLALDLAAIVGIVVPVLKNLARIKAGTRCELRAEMLRIYYKNAETETVRQYEAQNFALLYEAYKALGGNSFIDEIAATVKKWKVKT